MQRHEESRCGPRAPFDSWVEIISGGDRCRARAIDLGPGGIGIAASQLDLRADTKVVSEFPLPGIGLPLALECTVRWVDRRNGRGGLRFLDVDSGLNELLESYLDGRLTG